MASEWAYKIARNQRRDVETMATNLDAARIEGLEEALRIGKENMYSICAFKEIRDRIEEVKG